MAFYRCKQLSMRRFACLLIVMLLSACQYLSPSSPHDPGQQTVGVSAGDTQKIDHLLELIDQRLGVASKVAKSKWNSGAAVDDPKREAQILDNLTRQSDTIAGLDPVFVRKFFQNQFDAGKIIQKNLLSDWLSQFPLGYKFDDAPDLARDVRPILDKLTPELIVALRDVQPLLKQPGVERYLSLKSTVLIRGDVDGDVRHQALETLLAL
ncbi:gamma subclass chorismate mutase AroQ [Glaciimonas sp. GG7]